MKGPEITHLQQQLGWNSSHCQGFVSGFRMQPRWPSSEQVSRKGTSHFIRLPQGVFHNGSAAGTMNSASSRPWGSGVGPFALEAIPMSEAHLGGQ